VFVVASAREDIDIGQVLFEFGGMQRDSAPSRETGKANTTIPEKGVGGNSKQSAVVYAMDSFSSNSMKSANPHSGFHEEQIARTIDTNGTNPTTNQGGNLVLQPIGDDNDGEFMVVPSHSLSGTIVASNNECVTRATGIETPLAITFKVRAGGNSTGERGGQPNQSGGVGYLEATEQTFTISTTQDQYLAIAYTMREDATNNTFSINETEVALTLQALQPTINSHHAQNIVQEVPMTAHEPILWETSHGYDPVRVMDDPTLSPTLTAKMGTGGNNVPMLTQSMHDNVFAPLMARAGSSPDGSLGFPIVNSGMRVRRLTPVECERLQGFPDDFTKVPYRNKSATDCPDGLRYQALGNSWAVPVITWIGHRIMKLVTQ
jgi:site-specific DNA-cytosine methylase